MSLKIGSAIAATALFLAACSSGGDPEADAAFCEASAGWGEGLSVLGAQISALGSVSDGVEDPTDPTAVSMMHQIGADLLSQAATTEALANQAIANTGDQGVIDSIEEVNQHIVVLAIAMGEDARDSADLIALAEAIAEDYELFQAMADFDIDTAMTVISEYGEPICQTSE